MNDDGSILVGAGLRKSFGRGDRRVEVLHGLDLQVRRGEFVAVMGPSGCGKSTLLHLLGLMTPPDAGQIQILGQDVPPRGSMRTQLRRRAIGFVFQRFNLLGVLSARDNIHLSLRVRGLANAATHKHVETLFETMNISHVAARKPGEMSIGEQQRVAVVRALAHQPALLLADEPTGNLDSENGGALLELFQAVHERDGQTIVMITHSAEAARYADRTLHMRDGRLTDA